MHLKPHKTGLALGAFVGLLHIIWSLIVALGWAQALVQFKLSMHMVSVPITILPFDIGTAVALVIMAAIVGYVLGYLFAVVCNRVGR